LEKTLTEVELRDAQYTCKLRMELEAPVNPHSFTACAWRDRQAASAALAGSVPTTRAAPEVILTPTAVS
jgi:hypothetical protein